MKENVEKSQIFVFKLLSAKLSAIQRQQHQYHIDRFLRDQLIRSADSSLLRRTLRERVPSTSQEAEHRIAALLSSEPGSASNFAVAEGTDLVDSDVFN